MIGGSFGTAVFGAIFANLLTGNLAKYLHGIRVPSNVVSQTDNPQILDHLPAAVHAGIAAGISRTVEEVFLVGVPIAAVAFALSWLLPELPLRKSIATLEIAEGIGLPGQEASSLEGVPR